MHNQKMFHYLVSLTLVVVLALLSSAYPSPAVNQATLAVYQRPTLVYLRIEGSEKTIFEGPVLTRGHNVTTISGGNHHCDGTNNNANPRAGPTCTSALDDAAKRHGFTFDGTFSIEFDDFSITSIDEEAQTASQFWGILLNSQFIQVGGCQQQVKFGDNVLFAFDAFNKAHFLKLTGPHIAHVGQEIILNVTDSKNGGVVAGADVNGNISDANGHVSVSFADVGLKKVKAQKSDSVRSNGFFILVIR